MDRDDKNQGEFLARYGTEFEELEDEKAGISKKPLSVENQVVTDEKGRRRFHGAFTGGFSAGYFNSVGTKEGWTPSTFKSTRDERVSGSSQRPEDFMDDDDLGEHGIAPRQIRTTKDFENQKNRDNTSADGGQKRRLAWEHEGVVAPEALGIDSLVKPVENSFGIQLLKKMGWRQGRGIGARMKLKALKKQKANEKRMYGCELPPGVTLGEGGSSSDSEEEEFTKDLLFAPDDVDQHMFEVKNNVHGLGYKGINQAGVLKQTYGQKESILKSGKKGAKGIRGQAFGVGAFEEDDEDIYNAGDLSQYDFALGGTGTSTYDTKQVTLSDEFVEAEKSQSSRKFYAPPKLPRDFVPGVKLATFQLANEFLPVLENMKTKLNPMIRAQLLGESAPSVRSMLSESDRAKLDAAKLKSKEVAVKEEPPDSFQPTTSTVDFDPNAFTDDPKKRQRFMQFVSCLKRGFTTPQPPELTEWEWEIEMKEFVLAISPHLRQELTGAQERQLPLAKPEISTTFAHLLKSKFTTAKHDVGEVKKGGEDEDKVQAVRMKMFGRLTREKLEWHPERNLCKRFNLPNPYPDSRTAGCPSLQKPTKSNREMFLVGNNMLPTTAQELTNRNEEREKNYRRGETLKSEPQTPHTPATEEEIQTEKEGGETERPPIDLFKAIFDDESEAEEEKSSSENEDVEKETQPQTTSTQKTDQPIPPPSHDGISAQRTESGFEPMSGNNVSPSPNNFGGKIPKQEILVDTPKDIRDSDDVIILEPDPIPSGMGSSASLSYGPSLPPPEADMNALLHSMISRHKKRKKHKERKKKKSSKDKKKHKQEKSKKKRHSSHDSDSDNDDDSSYTSG